MLTVLALIWVEISQRTRGFREISPAQAVPLINRQDARVVDVSSAKDFQAGHIIGARHAPKSQWQPVAQKLMKFPDRPVLVVDKNGQTTAPAAAALVKAGLNQVVTLKGGMVAWRTDNYPISRPGARKKAGRKSRKADRDSNKSTEKPAEKATADQS